MQAFTLLRNNGVNTTTAIDQSLMKTFADTSALDLACQGGIVNEGEIVATVDDDHANVLPTDQLREMQEEIRALQRESSGIEELLPPDVSTENLIASINEVKQAINELDVSVAGGAGKYIKAISETNGKISATEQALDTTITSGSTVAPTSDAVYNAIDTAVKALDVASVGGTNKYISAIEETDGKISATAGTIDTTVTTSSDNLITSGAVKTALNALMEALYPVGSIYMNVTNGTNPGTLLGFGTWTAIEGRFIIGADSTYTARGTGGGATKTIGVNNLPAHTHSLSGITASVTTTDALGDVNIGPTTANSYTTGPWTTDNATLVDIDNDIGVITVDGAVASGCMNKLKFHLGHSHTGTASLSGDTGNNTTTATALDVLNPYKAAYIWQRTA